MPSRLLISFSGNSHIRSEHTNNYLQSLEISTTLIYVFRMSSHCADMMWGDNHYLFISDSTLRITALSVLIIYTYSSSFKKIVLLKILIVLSQIFLQ